MSSIHASLSGSHAALAMTIVLCALCCAVILPLSSHAAGKLPEPGIPQSCGMQMKGGDWTNTVIREIHADGYTTVRKGFYWTSVEKVKGTYTFEDFDEQMNLCKELGLKVVGVLFHDNKDYEDNNSRGVTTEAGRKGFAAFAAALAEHYKDYDVIWEVWNEPNTMTFWGKHGKQGNSPEYASEYTALVKEVAKAMLEKDPDCMIAAGSVSNYWEPSYQWTESCFKLGILKSGIRVWSVHPYGVKTPEEFAIGHKRTRELMKKYGSPDFPMIDTERGFSLGKTTGGARENEGWSGGGSAGAKQFQAWNLVRQYMIDQLYGLNLTVWYEWHGKEFGIDDRKGPTEARSAASEMIRELSGYKLVKRLEANHYLDYVLLWKDPDNNQKLVAWTAPPPGSTPDTATPHEATVSMTSGDPLTLKLTPKPQYVALPEGAVPGKVTAQGKFVFSEAEMKEEAKGLDEPIDLGLFKEGTEWEFVENTGKGSFKLAKDDDDGKEIGILTYDFTNPTGKGTPYVLAGVKCNIEKGPNELIIHVRSAIKQYLTFRLIDKTGQTLQCKKKIKEPGKWTAITIPLAKKMERWGGANDGFAHLPIKNIWFSVPRPSPEQKTGKVEYSDIIVK